MICSGYLCNLFLIGQFFENPRLGEYMKQMPLRDNFNLYICIELIIAGKYERGFCFDEERLCNALEKYNISKVNGSWKELAKENGIFKETEGGDFRRPILSLQEYAYESARNMGMESGKEEFEDVEYWVSKKNYNSGICERCGKYSVWRKHKLAPLIEDYSTTTFSGILLFERTKLLVCGKC